MAVITDLYTIDVPPSVKLGFTPRSQSSSGPKIKDHLSLFGKISTLFGFWPFIWSPDACGAIKFSCLSKPVFWIGVHATFMVLLVINVRLSSQLDEAEKKEMKMDMSLKLAENVGISLVSIMSYTSGVTFTALSLWKRRDLCHQWNRFSQAWTQVEAHLAALRLLAPTDTEDMPLSSSSSWKLITFYFLCSCAAIPMPLQFWFTVVNGNHPWYFLVVSGITTFYWNLMPFVRCAYVLLLVKFLCLWGTLYSRLKEQVNVLGLVVETKERKFLEAVLQPALVGRHEHVTPVMEIKSSLNPFYDRGLKTIVRTIHEVDDTGKDFVSAIKWHLLYALCALGVPVLFGMFLMVTWRSDESQELQYMFLKMNLLAHVIACVVTLCEVANDCGNITVRYHQLVNTLTSGVRWDSMTKSTRIQVQNCIQKMYSSPFVVCPGGCVTINNGLLTSLATGAITYFVILLQFNTA